VTSIASGAVVNADINASAAIAHSKLASMSSGNILVGSSGSVPTSVAVTGDVTVNSSGTTTIESGAVTFAKMQTISDYQIIGRNSGLGAGSPQSITCSSFAFSLLEDGDASSARSTLGLGSMATQSSGSISITGGTISNVAFGSGISLSTPLVATSGGTGFGAYTIGDILYANTASTLQKLPDVATGNALISGGVGAAPSYGKIGLTTHVSGSLPVANGGTGVTTSTGSGANVLATSPVLVTPQLGTPTSGTLTSCTGLPLTTGVTGILPVANGGTGVTALASGFIKSDGTILTSSEAPISIADGGTGVTQSTYGEYYISSITATSIGTTGTFVKVNGTTTAGFLSNFTHPASNRLTYTGTATRKFLIAAALSFHGTATNDYKFAFHKNTSSLLSPSIISTTGAGAGDLAHVSIQTIVELATNDFIEVFVTNADAPNSATIDFMNVTAVALI
jgi:hypothetical protein